MLVTIKKLLSVLLLAIVLTVIFTWPFSRYLGSYYYDRGDYALTGFLISWNENAILSGKIFDKEYYFNGGQFYPQPYSQLFSDLRLLPTLIFIPIHFLTQNFVLSLNLVIFLSFVLSFLSSFFVINYFLKDKYASIIGGVIYTFNPLTFSRIPEHFELLQKYLLPLVFLSAFKLIKEPNFKNCILFSVIFTLNCFSAIYFQIFTLILLPIFLLPFVLIKLHKKDGLYFKKLLISFSVFLFFIPIILYFNLGYKDFSQKEFATRDLESATFFSARLIDYFSSNKQSFLYGQWTGFLDPYRAPKDASGNFNYIEHTLFLGVIPTVLFIIGLYLYFKKRKFLNEINLIYSSFFILAIVSLVLTFGPFFQGWNSNDGGLPIPYYFLYQISPIFQAIRAPSRFLFIFYLPFSLFCSLGFIYLYTKIKRQSLKRVIFISLIIGLLLENLHPSAPIVSYKEKSQMFPYVEKLKRETNLSFLKDKNVLHLPLMYPNLGFEGEYLNWAVKTGEKVVNGNSGYIPLEQINFFENLKDLDSEKIKILSLLDVDYIIVHKNKLKAENKIDFTSKEMGAKIFENSDLIIFEISHIKNGIKKCNFESDIKYQINNAIVEGSNQNVTLLVLQNSNDCYFTSIYDQKYKTIKLTQADFLGGPVEKTIQLKLPVVIYPNEQIILSDYNNQLKFE